MTIVYKETDKVYKETDKVFTKCTFFHDLIKLPQYYVTALSLLHHSVK